MPEPKLIYEKIEGKSQRGLSVRAPSYERLYINAGLALVDSVIGLDRVQVASRKTVHVSGKDLTTLMDNWLNALCQLLSREHFITRRIVFENFNGQTITAAIHGEDYDRLRHGVVPATALAPEPKMQMGDSGDPLAPFFVRWFLSENAGA